MEHVILGLLIFNKMTIYELNSAFKQGLSLIYSASYGSLQNAVKKLLKMGLIEYTELVENGRNKKIYTIKESGTQAFFDWMNSEIPVNKLEVVILSKVYFLGLISSKEDKITIVEEMISKTKQVELELRDYGKKLETIELPDNQMTIAKYQFKTLDYGIMSHSSAGKWLLDLLNDIESE